VDVALKLEKRLVDEGRLTEIHEGDNIRAFGYLTVVRGRPGTVIRTGAPTATVTGRPTPATATRMATGTPTPTTATNPLPGAG
jgi:hypothetical protein